MNVVLLIYNRPEWTRRVFERVAEARPDRLFVVADGPKDEADRVRCEAARAVVARPSWPCRVERRYAERNLGCRRNVPGGLDWVFAQVGDAIVLEDDCVPEVSFFGYCAELLERFRDDARVGHISGNNYLSGAWRTPHSYGYSRFSASWGWATWRRAWEQFDGDLTLWPELKAGGWHLDMFASREAAYFFEDAWDGIRAGNPHIWDTQWLFARLVHGTVSVIPRVNLVSNIGFGPDATYTTDPNDPAAAWPTEPMALPLRHPPSMICDTRADEHFVRLFIKSRKSPWRRAVGALRNRHFYGACIRRVPGLGRFWARWRGT